MRKIIRVDALVSREIILSVTMDEYDEMMENATVRDYVNDYLSKRGEDVELHEAEILSSENTNSFADFCEYMVNECGMDTTDEVPMAVHCCECGEPIYESDAIDHDWDSCPVCCYDLNEGEVE